MNQNIFTMLKGNGNAGFRQSTLNLDSYIQGMLPQHSQFTCFGTDAIEANKVSDPFMIRSDAILHASVAKSGHTNTTRQQKFKHMLKRLSMLQNLTKLSTSKQNLQLLFGLRNIKEQKTKTS
jgi:hypothetical protein